LRSGSLPRIIESCISDCEGLGLQSDLFSFGIGNTLDRPVPGGSIQLKRKLAIRPAKWSYQLTCFSNTNTEGTVSRKLARMWRKEQFLKVYLRLSCLFFIR
jgi:hypothetical protein